MPPLTAGSHDIEQAVQQAPHVRGPRSPAGLGRRDERLDQAILIMAQSLAGKVAEPSAICRCPHAGLLAGEPQNATITAAQPSSSHPADPFKTGC